MKYRFVFLRKTYLERRALHTLPCLSASGLLDQWSVTGYRSVRVRRREGGGKAAAAICWLINVLHHLTFGFMKRFYVYIYLYIHVYPQLGSVCRSRFSDVRINCRPHLNAGNIIGLCCLVPLYQVHLNLDTIFSVIFI